MWGYGIVMGKPILLNEELAPSDELDEFRELQPGSPGTIVVVDSSPPPPPPPGGS